MKRGRKLFAGIYMALLLACSIYILLDQFVIPRAIVRIQEPEATAVPAMAETPEPEETATPESTATPEPEETATPAPTETPEPEETAAPAPTDPPLSGPEVTLSTIRIFDTDVHIADIRIPDASYLRTAMAQNTYGRNIKQTVAEMAADHNALIAINGDYFGFRYEGYVIRGGVLYRDEIYDSDQEDLCIWPDGNMTVIRETEVSAEELMSQGVQDVLCFGPALVLDGEIQISEELEVGTYSDDNPRTAIAMVEPLHYLFVVSDGRTEENIGLTPYQLAVLLRDRGAQLVYNLDGGGSSTMVYEGEIINYPTARGYWEERRVSDIVYISR